MFGSIFTGLSGMHAFSNGLRQISNNITNINSTGFKASTLRFVDLFGAGGRGSRSGQGVALAEPRLDFSQGELRQSDRDLDLAIDGDGFLVLLRDADKVFARTGSFEINEKGDIVLAGTDYKLTVLDEAGNPTAINVEPYRTSPPQRTTTVTFADNLSSTSSAFTLSNIKVFDAQGAVENWSAKFIRAADAAPGEWKVTVTNGSSVEVGAKTLKFIAGIVDPANAQLTFDSGERSATFDFATNVTSFSSGEVSTLRIAKSDGYAAGEITGVTVTDAGVMEIAYSNEQKKALGAVTVATFRDPQTLTQRGGGLFGDDHGAGLELLRGERENVRVVSKRLEASNVDLSREFGDLILVQRGFQASSQVVSVSNDMIQQLFGIRGQG